MTKAEMSNLVREVYMLMMSETSMYSQSPKMAQFLIDRIKVLAKMDEIKNDD